MSHILMEKVIENHNLRIRVLYRPPEQTLEAVRLQGFLFCRGDRLKRRPVSTILTGVGWKTEDKREDCCFGGGTAGRCLGKCSCTVECSMLE